MNQTIATGRIKIIEDLFRKYPDTPQEVVIKQDLLSLGERFSDNALAASAISGKKPYGLFSLDLVPMSDMQRQEYLKVPGEFFIKGGPYRLRPVRMKTLIAPDSPYLIDVIDGHLKLCLDGAAIADVGYRPPFKYYSKSFPDGTAYRDIIVEGSILIPFRFCQFWGVREECKFCDINENSRQVRKFRPNAFTAPVKKVDQVAEVANEIVKELQEREGYPAPIRFFISGGAITSHLHGLKEDEFYHQYVEAVKRGGPRRYVTLQTNAPDKVTLKEYRSKGVDYYHGDLEVWDKRLFEWLCPGKFKRVGWEEWVKRLLEAVDIFGEGHVISIFVGGVEMAQPYGFKTVNEAVKSSTEGIKFLMSHGVRPNFNVWSRGSRAYLLRKYKQPPVPPEFYLQLMRNYYENWKRYELPLPPRIHGSPDLSVIERCHSIDDDYLRLMEQKDYENLALEALEKVGTVWSYSPKCG